MEGGEVWEADAVDLISSLPDESVDLILTDPPYESVERWRSIGTTTRLKQSGGSSNPWFKVFPDKRYYELFRGLYRVMKPSSFLYMFCNEETRDLVCTGYSPQTDKHIDEQIGMPASTEEWGWKRRGSRLGYGPLILAKFKYWKSIVWNKVIKGMGYHFPAQHELIIMAEKVKGPHRKLNHNLTGDVIQTQRLKGKQYYPTEKPFELIQILVEESCNENDVVLDPFCGSGVLGQVCRKLKRRFILGDINPEEALRRLK
jgi:site-specific DNA-methyltransferase (adenine-specific)